MGVKRTKTSFEDCEAMLQESEGGKLLKEIANSRNLTVGHVHYCINKALTARSEIFMRFRGLEPNVIRALVRNDIDTREKLDQLVTDKGNQFEYMLNGFGVTKAIQLRTWLHKNPS